MSQTFDTVCEENLRIYSSLEFGLDFEDEALGLKMLFQTVKVRFMYKKEIYFAAVWDQPIVKTSMREV